MASARQSSAPLRGPLENQVLNREVRSSRTRPSCCCVPTGYSTDKYAAIHVTAQAVLHKMQIEIRLNKSRNYLRLIMAVLMANLLINYHHFYVLISRQAN